MVARYHLHAHVGAVQGTHPRRSPRRDRAYHIRARARAENVDELEEIYEDSPSGAGR